MRQCNLLTENIEISKLKNLFSTFFERLKFSLIIGNYWRVPEGSKFSEEKIISTGELLNFYQNINSTRGFLFHWSTNYSYQGALEFEPKLIILPEGFLIHWRD